MSDTDDMADIIAHGYELLLDPSDLAQLIIDAGFRRVDDASAERTRELIAQTIHAERGRVMRQTNEDDEEANGEIIGLTKAWNIARDRADTTGDMSPRRRWQGSGAEAGWPG